MTRQELIALWEFAEYLELIEKGSKSYQDIKKVLLEEITGGKK